MKNINAQLERDAMAELEEEYQAAQDTDTFDDRADCAYTKWRDVEDNSEDSDSENPDFWNAVSHYPKTLEMKDAK